MAVTMIASLIVGPGASALDEERDGPFVTRSTFTGNYDVVYAEMGLYPNLESGTLTVDVPAGATEVVAAYLWWSGRIRDRLGAPPDSGDDTVDIVINGGAAQTITATDTFYADASNSYVHYNYWFDLTDQIGLGTSTITLSDFDLQWDTDSGNRHNGFGVAVVYAEPTVPESTIVIRDGNDRAYFDWDPPAGPDSAVQCLDLEPSVVDQVVEITVNITAVDADDVAPRPQTIWWLTGTGAQPSGDDADASGIKAGAAIVNPVPTGPGFTDPYGFEWFTWDATVPAGDTWVCAQLESVDDNPGQIGATTGWSAAGYAFPTLHRIGNLVWIDTNGNGIAEAGEPGIAGVTVELYDAGGVLIASTTTDADGKYEFPGLPAGDYEVLIPAGQAVLDGLSSTTIDEADPNTDLDNDDNGLADAAGVRSGTITVGDAVGPDLSDDASNEPVDETLRADDTTDDDPPDTVYEDVRSNFTVDFGFLGEGGEETFSIGNQVWFDADEDGLRDDGEDGIAGVVVWLIDADGNVVAEVTTDADGLYLFTDVPAGDYTVKLADENFDAGGPLEGHSPTPITELDPNTDIDNDSNATVMDGMVVSGTVTVGDGEPTGEDPNNDPGTADENSNLTVDFGLILTVENPISIGNLVWNDLNDNGLVDEGEPVLPDVTVNLWTVDADGALLDLVASTATDDEGHYAFLVAEGTYLVQIPADEFTPGAPLEGFASSTPTFDPAGGDDNDDNGASDPTLGVVTASFEVTLGTAPTGEADPDPFGLPDADSNLTIDLGLVDTFARIGNFVWFDEKTPEGGPANGVQDPGEPGIPGVTVRIYNMDGALVATTVTDATGFYEFRVPPGDYWLEFEWDPTIQVATANPELYDPADPLELVATDVGTDDAVDSDGSASKTAGNVAGTEVTTLDPGEFDPTWDLGLTRTVTAVQAEQVAIGNLVWWDQDLDGIADPGEPRLGGVTVEIWASDAAGNIAGTTPLATTVTDSSGHYYVSFDQATLNVRVRIAPENFAKGGPLRDASGQAMFSTTGTLGGDNGVDNDDNGIDVSTPQNGGVWSGVIALAANTEPTGEADPIPAGVDFDELDDDDADFTVDFGFVGCDGVSETHPVTGASCVVTGNDSDTQAGFGLMLLGLGTLLVLGASDRSRRRLMA